MALASIGAIGRYCISVEFLRGSNRDLRKCHRRRAKKSQAMQPRKKLLQDFHPTLLRCLKSRNGAKVARNHLFHRDRLTCFGSFDMINLANASNAAKSDNDCTASRFREVLISLGELSDWQSLGIFQSILTCMPDLVLKYASRRKTNLGCLGANPRLAGAKSAPKSLG